MCRNLTGPANVLELANDGIQLSSQCQANASQAAWIWRWVPIKPSGLNQIRESNLRIMQVIITFVIHHLQVRNRIKMCSEWLWAGEALTSPLAPTLPSAWFPSLLIILTCHSMLACTLHVFSYCSPSLSRPSRIKIKHQPLWEGHQTLSIRSPTINYLKINKIASWSW